MTSKNVDVLGSLDYAIRALAEVDRISPMTVVLDDLRKARDAVSTICDALHEARALVAAVRGFADGPMSPALQKALYLAGADAEDVRRYVDMCEANDVAERALAALSHAKGEGE